MRSRPASPLTYLALAVVGVGLLGTVWSRRRPPASICDAPPCAPPPADAGQEPETSPSGPAGPALAAETTCLGVAYLCAEMDQVGSVTVRRWRDFQGTMVVHVPRPALEDAALAVRLQQAAAAGIRLWHLHPFPILVDERGTREAHFSVRWVPSLGGNRIGMARTQWSSRSGLGVLSLELVTQDPLAPRPMDPRDVRLVAAHEMGHALGLPHSDEPRDVMYPTNTATVLSARDYRTLEALYQLPDGAVIQPGPSRRP